MDGRKAWLRSLIVASLATSSSAAHLVGDDFIRPPAKTQPVPVRVGTINQPAAPVIQSPPAERPVAAQVTPAPVVNQLELTDQPVAANPIALPTTPSRQSVPAQVTSARTTGSTLNWQRRGGRPSLSVETKQPTQENTSVGTHDPLGGDDVPQVPVVGALESPEFRLVVPQRPEDVAAAEQVQQRRELAAKISNELLSESKATGSTSGNAIEPGPGWQAVGDELKQRVQKCDELLARRAYLSAMQEAEEAIVRLVRVLDLKENRFASEPTWAEAQQALREAQEFTSVIRIGTDPELFTRLIQSHQTPVLKEANVAELTPLAAAQHYRAYAEQCLVAASQGHPWFCELYYCLGRSLQAQAETNPSKADGLLHQSIAYFRAAQAIDPTNVTNANQLGYVLLRLDRPSEAIQQLQQIVQQPNCPLESWQNLAQASSRLGDAQMEKWAVDNYMAAKSRGAAPSGPVNTLVQVSEEQFRAMSPRTVGPSGMTPTNMVNSANGNTYAPMNTSNAGNVAPTQGNSPDAGGRTAILPRTGLFR